MNILVDNKLAAMLRKVCQRIWPTQEHFRLGTSGAGMDSLVNPDFIFLAPENHGIRTKMASAVVNDHGQLLINSVRANQSQIEEDIANGTIMLPEVWEKIKVKGAKIVYVDLLYRSNY